MALLTDRTLATGVTLQDLIHIVIPTDLSQNPAGSSYKATIEQVGDALSGSSFNTYVTGGTYSAGTATFTNNNGGTFDVTGFTQSFTGNTSGDCITDLYITNLYGCSPITVHDNIQSVTSSATGTTSFAFGFDTKAYGDYSHAEGYATTASGNYSHAEGYFNIASGEASHSEGGYPGKGYFNIASGIGSHAEGIRTSATTDSSHAEGGFTLASGQASHAEGGSTTASGQFSHAEGANTTASGQFSHAEGANTTASGDYSHAQGYKTIASGYWSTASGYYTTASGDYSSASGSYTTASGYSSNAEGESTTAIGKASHAEGSGTLAQGIKSHAEGYNTTASGDYSHSEGYGGKFGVISSGFGSHAEGGETKAIGDYSHSEGRQTIASGNTSHSEGYNTTASGDYSHAEGYGGKFGSIASGFASHTQNSQTTASGDYSHAEGFNTTASGKPSHAEGTNTTAIGIASHSEGNQTITSGYTSHAEGNQTTAIGTGSHAEGYNTTASGDYSHAEGYGGKGFGIASGLYSHSEGFFTIAQGNSSHAEGENTISIGRSSHAEGVGTTASDYGSHSEGETTTAIGRASHAEGFNTIAIGNNSHAEGNTTTASGYNSHAEGSGTIAIGNNSHAEGSGTIAIGNNSHAEGSFTTASGVYSHASGNNSVASGETSFIHSTNSLVTGVRSVLLGGQNLTGTTDDTVYVPFLNINNLGTGTYINNLGIDSNGNIVSAITYTDGNTIIGDGSLSQPLSVIGSNSTGNLLLTGGASYSNSGLTFDVSVLTYLIGGIQYTTSATTVTLSTGDTVNPRFDAIVADENEVVSVIEGTPDATPLTPAIGEDQVLVQYVLIGAGATTPNITTQYIYREGSTPDWTGSFAGGYGTTADFTYTGITPYQGSECTLATIGRYGSSRGVRWSTGTPVNREDYLVLSFRVYLPSDLTAAGVTLFRIFAWDDNLQTNYIGWVNAHQYMDMSLTGTWQFVSIPTGLFNQNLSANSIGFLNFTLYKPPSTVLNPTEDIALDDIKLQTGYLPPLNSPTIDVLENDVAIGSTSKLNFIDGINTMVVLTEDNVNNKIDVQVDLSFTGNTSGDCINDIYIKNIHSCSPLNINPNDEGNVYFGSSSGITIDLTNERLGIGTSSPQYPLQVLGTNSTFYYDPTSAGGRFNLSGNTNIPRYDISIPPYLTNPATGGSFGMRTWDDVTFPGYGKVGDMFIYAGNDTNGLNIINGPGTGTEDYIRFYVGQTANGTTPDIHIQGSGSTRGYVGIGIETPLEKLHVDGGDFLVSNTNGKFYTDIENATGPTTLLSGNTTGLSRIGVVVPTYDSVTFGVRGPSEPIGAGYGKQGDAFIYSSNANNGINIISSQGTGTDDYIRFYAGQTAASTTPDLYIQGSGSTGNVVRGNIGINNNAPTSKLDINGTTGYKQLRLRNSYTPSSTADTNGEIGDISWDNSYFYIKTGTGWGRLPLDYVF